jgi:hypothetical protein
MKKTTPKRNKIMDPIISFGVLLGCAPSSKGYLLDPFRLALLVELESSSEQKEGDIEGGVREVRLLVLII